MCKHIVITNSKGGVAASTTAVNIGHWLALHSNRTLLLETDRQADLPKLLNLPFGNEAANYLERLIDAEAAIKETGRTGLYYIPGDGDVEAAAKTLSFQINQKRTDAEKRAVLDLMADRIFGAASDFDAMIVDPPKSGDMQQAALRRATLLIVPFMFDYASISNAVSLVMVADGIMQAYGSIVALPIGGGARLSKDQKAALHELQTAMQSMTRYVKVAEGIPFRAEIKKAGFSGKTIWESAPNGPVAKAYDKFCHTFLGV